ncbi:hypothetical protein CDAR_275221 [Caerostris darwini]|uniref:Uncharacterized protein n=1 Tax=Caerostris darwini TaxID=1538125 RepID=A0AAV4VXS7_9ARAC|nr:hypothetical protein CDAR_275221 [Caerostris darwini]
MSYFHYSRLESFAGFDLEISTVAKERDRVRVVLREDQKPIFWGENPMGEIFATLTTGAGWKTLSFFEAKQKSYFHYSGLKCFAGFDLETSTVATSKSDFMRRSKAHFLKGRSDGRNFRHIKHRGSWKTFTSLKPEIKTNSYNFFFQK